jgi:hypothetical protein
LLAVKPGDAWPTLPLDRRNEACCDEKQRSLLVNRLERIVSISGERITRLLHSISQSYSAASFHLAMAPAHLNLSWMKRHQFRDRQSFSCIPLIPAARESSSPTAPGVVDSLLLVQASKSSSLQKRFMSAQRGPIFAESCHESLAVAPSLGSYRQMFNIDRRLAWVLAQHLLAVKRSLQSKLALSVRCPTCGAARGEKCELTSGQPRTDPHLDRQGTTRAFALKMPGLRQ